MKAYIYREPGAMVYSIDEDQRIDSNGSPYTMITMSDGVAFHESVINEFFAEVVDASHPLANQHVARQSA